MAVCRVLVVLLLVLTDFSVVWGDEVGDDDHLLVLTVASERTDGFERYLRSAKVNNLKGKVAADRRRRAG